MGQIIVPSYKYIIELENLKKIYSAFKYSMTYILGIKCKEGIALIADRKIVYHDNSTKYAEKLIVLNKNIVLGASGSKSSIDKFNDYLIQQKLNLIDPSNLYDFTNLIENAVREINDKQRKLGDYDFDILIAVSTESLTKIKYFYSTGKSEDIGSYQVIGSGEPYGSFFLKKFWKEDMNLVQAAEIGFRIIRYIEINDLDLSVGTGPYDPQIVFVTRKNGVNKASFQLTQKLRESCREWLNHYTVNTISNYGSITGTDDYIPLTSIGSKGYGPLRFCYPEGIGIDSKSNIFVADQGNNVIQKIDSNGSFVTLWGNTNNSKIFQESYALAIDSEDNIFITDNNSLRKYNNDGSLINWSPKSFDFRSAHGITIDNDDNIFVSDESLNQIKKYTKDGELVCCWGSYCNMDKDENCNTETIGAIEPGDGQFDHPLGLVTDAKGNIYVADSLNNRIQKFDNEGRFILKWGSIGIDAGEIYYPFGLAIASSGEILVVEHLNDRIQKFSLDGKFRSKFGSIGQGPDQFHGPRFICIDEKNRKIYVTDGSNQRIQILSTTWEEFEFLNTNND